MCLVLVWNCGFFDIAIAPWLSPKITVVFSSGTSLYSFNSSWSRARSQTASFVAAVCPMYSASHEDRATVLCLFELQLIAPVPRLNTYPDVDLRVSRSPAQSESV